MSPLQARLLRHVVLDWLMPNDSQLIPGGQRFFGLAF